MGRCTVSLSSIPSRLWLFAVVMVPLLSLGRSSPACACIPRKMKYAATMRSDLRQVAVAQAGLHQSRGRYEADLSVLGVEGSAGVTIAIEADSTGWVARARHHEATGGCIAGVGSRAPPVQPGLDDFSLSCDPIADLYDMKRQRPLAIAGWLVVIAMIAMVRRTAWRFRIAPPRTSALLLLAIANPLWLVLAAGWDIVPVDCNSAVVLMVATLFFIPLAILIGLSNWARVMKAVPDSSGSAR